MNKLVLLCLFSAGVCAVASAAADGPVCGEGSHWLQGCNRCNCINGGAACTKRLCLPGYTPPAGTAVCQEGSWWKTADGCNTCSCSGGNAICTQRFCEPARPARSARSADAECDEGVSFWERCNHCSCGADGRKRCTKKACNPAVPHPNHGKCEGDRLGFKDERNCNWCRCLGGMGVCTRRACF